MLLSDGKPLVSAIVSSQKLLGQAGLSGTFFHFLLFIYIYFILFFSFLFFSFLFFSFLFISFHFFSLISLLFFSFIHPSFSFFSPSPSYRGPYPCPTLHFCDYSNHLWFFPLFFLLFSFLPLLFSPSSLFSLLLLLIATHHHHTTIHHHRKRYY